MKVGMFLQDRTLPVAQMNKTFYNVLQIANESKLDLLVFPEHMYCPDDKILDELSFFKL